MSAEARGALLWQCARQTDAFADNAHVLHCTMLPACARGHAASRGVRLHAKRDKDSQLFSRVERAETMLRAAAVRAGAAAAQGLGRAARARAHARAAVAVAWIWASCLRALAATKTAKEEATALHLLTSALRPILPPIDSFIVPNNTNPAITAVSPVLVDAAASLILTGAAIAEEEDEAGAGAAASSGLADAATEFALAESSAAAANDRARARAHAQVESLAIAVAAQHATLPLLARLSADSQRVLLRVGLLLQTLLRATAPPRRASFGPPGSWHGVDAAALADAAVTLASDGSGEMLELAMAVTLDAAAAEPKVSRVFEIDPSASKHGADGAGGINRARKQTEADVMGLLELGPASVLLAALPQAPTRAQRSAALASVADARAVGAGLQRSDNAVTVSTKMADDKLSRGDDSDTKDNDDSKHNEEDNNNGEDHSLAAAAGEDEEEEEEGGRTLAGLLLPSPAARSQLAQLAMMATARVHCDASPAVRLELPLQQGSLPVPGASQAAIEFDSSADMSSANASLGDNADENTASESDERGASASSGRRASNLAGASARASASGSDSESEPDSGARRTTHAVMTDADSELWGEAEAEAEAAAAEAQLEFGADNEAEADDDIEADVDTEDANAFHYSTSSDEATRRRRHVSSNLGGSSNAMNHGDIADDVLATRRVHANHDHALAHGHGQNADLSAPMIGASPVPDNALVQLARRLRDVRCHSLRAVPAAYALRVTLTGATNAGAAGFPGPFRWGLEATVSQLVLTASVAAAVASAHGGSSSGSTGGAAQGVGAGGGGESRSLGASALCGALAHVYGGNSSVELALLRRTLRHASYTGYSSSFEIEEAAEAVASAIGLPRSEARRVLRLAATTSAGSTNMSNSTSRNTSISNAVSGFVPSFARGPGALTAGTEVAGAQPLSPPLLVAVPNATHGEGAHRDTLAFNALAGAPREAHLAATAGMLLALAARAGAAVDPRLASAAWAAVVGDAGGEGRGAGLGTHTGGNHNAGANSSAADSAVGSGSGGGEDDSEVLAVAGLPVAARRGLASVCVTLPTSHSTATNAVAECVSALCAREAVWIDVFDRDGVLEQDLRFVDKVQPQSSEWHVKPPHDLPSSSVTLAPQDNNNEAEDSDAMHGRSSESDIRELFSRSNAGFTDGSPQPLAHCYNSTIIANDGYNDDSEDGNDDSAAAPVRLPAAFTAPLGALQRLAAADVTAARALLFADGQGRPLAPRAFAAAVTDIAATVALPDSVLAADAATAARNPLGLASGAGASSAGNSGATAGRAPLFPAARFVRVTFATRSAFAAAAVTALTGAGGWANADVAAAPAAGPAAVVPGAHARLCNAPVLRSLAALGLGRRAGSAAASGAAAATGGAFGGALAAAVREGMLWSLPATPGAAAASAHLRRPPFVTALGRGGLGAAAGSAAVTAPAAAAGAAALGPAAADSSRAGAASHANGAGACDQRAGVDPAAGAVSVSSASGAALTGGWALGLRGAAAAWRWLAGAEDYSAARLRAFTVVVGADGARCEAGAAVGASAPRGPPLSAREAAVAEALWEVLAEWGPKERGQFLQFVWGMAKLPAGLDASSGGSGGGNVQQFMRVHLTEWERNDERLPQSHTCFMLVELPCYSSKEVLRAKLALAICSQELTS